jgi:GNAT superfamily N-acetyltransferase
MDKAENVDKSGMPDAPFAFEIRAVIPEDLSALTSLICEFAAYEGEEDIAVSIEGLKKYLFEEPCGSALIAFLNDIPCGFVTYSTMLVTYQAKKSFLLDSLFVLEEYRGRGFGLKLIQAVAGAAREEGAVYIEWACYRWNHTAEKFYARIGANVLDWNMFRLSGDALKNLSEHSS